MKYIVSGISIIIAVIMSSCVFSPDKENFVELDPTIKIPEIYSETLDLDADTLYVWKYTQFNFDFRSSEQRILAVSLAYGNDTLNFASSSGSFAVNPETFPEGTSKVEIRIIAESGTGSMAEILGLEGVELKRSWVLVVEKVKPPEITITSTIENGFLKFSWNKMDKEYIESFKIWIRNDGLSESYSHEFTDKNITSFVDSLYVGGKITFNMWVNYQTSQGYTNTAIKEYSYDYPIALTFKENLEHLTISWTKNPFHFTPYFETSGRGAIPIDADSSYTITAPGLGNAQMYNIAFKPVKPASWPGQMSNHYARHSLGVKDKLKHKNVEYNSSIDAYFFKEEMSIKKAGLELVLKDSFNYSWDSDDKYTLAFSNDNQKLYSTVNGNFVVLNTSAAKLVSSTPLSFLPEEPTMNMTLKSLNDQTMLTGYRFLGGYRFVLFNPLTASLIGQSALLPDDFISLGNYLMDVSSDGRYAAYCSQKGLYVFEIVSNNKFVLRHRDANIYYSCFFDPNYPEKLVLNCPLDYKIFNCSTLKTEKINDRFWANPINIDPVTHYMLLVSYSKSKIYVYDMDNDVLKLEMNHHSMPFDFKLINNIIFVNEGYHFDISSYVD